MLESERSGGTIPPSADAEIDTTAVMVRLVRVVDAWMTSDRWSDYIEFKIMHEHTDWKRMIFRKEEFEEGVAFDMYIQSRVEWLKQFFLKKYKLIDDSPPSRRLTPRQQLLKRVEFLER